MIRPVLLTAVVVALGLASIGAWAQRDAVPEITIGRPAPNFSAVDEHGRRHRLTDYRGSFVVLEWVNHTCAFVKKHYAGNNMQALQLDAIARGVVWLTVASTPPGHRGYMDSDAAERFRNRYAAAPTNIILDPDGRMGRQYDVERTPEIFIIDPDGVLVYMGGMDDKATTSIADLDEAIDYVGNALDESLAGRPVSRPVTQAYGCPIDY